LEAAAHPGPEDADYEIKLVSPGDLFLIPLVPVKALVFPKVGTKNQRLVATFSLLMRTGAKKRGITDIDRKPEFGSDTADDSFRCLPLVFYVTGRGDED